MQDSKPKSTEKPMSLANKAKERDEKINERINAETPFGHNPKNNISTLAQKAYPENKAEQERYKAKITASLEKYVKGSIEDLWKYLESKYCKKTAIIEGILRFYAGEKGENEITLTKFLNPPELSATLPLDDALEESRANTLVETKTKLAGLLDEIRAKNPNV